MSMSITEAQREPTLPKFRAFKCQWQRPALLSAKVNHRFQLQILTGSKARAKLAINQTRGMCLSHTFKAGVGQPNHQGTQADPFDLLCMFLKQRKQEM